MKYSPSYEPNYFSLEDIVATNATVPCKVEIKIPGLGEMDRGSQSEHLEPGRRLELPIWMAFNLSKRHLVKPDFGKAYSQSAREILKAEPAVVDLLKQEAYFYETGIHVASLIEGEEAANLRKILQNTFQIRSKEIISLSQAEISKDVISREQLLSKEEKAVMLDGRARWLEVENWLSGKLSSAELAAVSVSNYLKRKRPREDSD
ncbi:DNA replication complex GINS protein PSF3 [Neocloeon triangulifer]|uniref:DNA replication complex GINS protein PSF3 n=1 Tax=Neocloeon triangulifer TaxID=2078957 RepID=UPI00286EEE04|nr:DNA replication complex GINS protein PSF3 [Neocloeon triangulifer]